MSHYKFTSRAGTPQECVAYRTLQDDAEATRWAVVYGYDDWTAVDEYGDPIAATEYDAVRAAEEVPEGISGADYVITGFALLAELDDRGLSEFAEHESFPDAAASLTEQVHATIIALRKNGIPTHTESFGETLGVFLDLFRVVSPGAIQWPTSYEVYTVIKKERDVWCAI